MISYILSLALSAIELNDPKKENSTVVTKDAAEMKKALAISILFFSFISVVMFMYSTHMHTMAIMPLTIAILINILHASIVINNPSDKVSENESFSIVNLITSILALFVTFYYIIKIAKERKSSTTTVHHHKSPVHHGRKH
jgi:hypothetical protein